MAVTTYSIDEIRAGASAKERFQKLDSERSTVLDRARSCSKLTIPSVVTDDGHTESDDLETPYQALGSRLVHNLASKLLLALLPPNTSFFRILPNPEIVELVQQKAENGKEQLEKQLVILEQELMKQIEREALRVPIFEAVKSLIIGGNALLYKTPTGIKSYRMANFVVLRDYSGNPQEIICKETITKDTLPEDILSQLSQEDTSDDTSTKKIQIYNRAVRKDGKWYEYQEVDDVFVEGSDVVYNKDSELPFIPLRWTSINGENYGRGLVEQYLGDFRSLESLYQLVLEASAVMSRVIFGKRPGGVVDIDDINEAENGVTILGDLEQEITTLRVDKGADLQVPMNMIQDLTRRLEQAFLVASSAARDSERTTATEIRYMAADLEKSLGGVYSILSLELQRPLAYLLLAQSKADIEKLGVDLVIVTGIEALGRNAELDKIMQFVQILQQSGGPEEFFKRMNMGVLIDKIGNSLSLDTTGLIKSEQQLQQEQQDQMQQQLAMQGAGAAVENAGAGLGQQVAMGPQGGQ